MAYSAEVYVPMGPNADTPHFASGYFATRLDLSYISWDLLSLLRGLPHEEISSNAMFASEGTPADLHGVRVEDLLALAHHPEVEMRPHKRGAWAYLACLPADLVVIVSAG